MKDEKVSKISRTTAAIINPARPSGPPLLPHRALFFLLHRRLLQKQLTPPQPQDQRIAPLPY